MAKKTIFIAGHRGLVGSALMRLYARQPDWEIITRTRAEVDLEDARATREFFLSARPQYVILAAAKVGGIKASYTHPVEFLLNNLKIQNNIIEAAHLAETRKLLFLGSTCIYPKQAATPIREDSLLTGPMEQTNEAYSIAKIAGIKLCQGYRKEYGRDFVTAMPANLFGPHDDFDPEHSHVLPSLMRRFHEAKKRNTPSVTLWGSGKPRREFLYVDDLADACAFLLDHYSSDEIINVGVGEDHSIRDVAETLKEITGYRGELNWDTSQPDGNPQRLLDMSKMRALGWRAMTPFRQGLEMTYRWFLENVDQAG
ncbi:MAG: GDP-L-fucose synthase [Verrucomicrobiota bacterium]